MHASDSSKGMTHTYYLCHYQSYNYCFIIDHCHYCKLLLITILYYYYYYYIILQCPKLEKHAWKF